MDSGGAEAKEHGREQPLDCLRPVSRAILGKHYCNILAGRRDRLGCHSQMPSMRVLTSGWVEGGGDEGRLRGRAGDKDT